MQKISRNLQNKAKFLELISDFSMMAGRKVNIKKLNIPLYTSNENVNIEIKNVISFKIARK